MTREEFRQRVEEAARNRPARAVEYAIQRHLGNGRHTSPGDVTACVALADCLAEYGERFTPAAEPVRGSHPPEVQLAEEQLLETIGESVRQIRQAIFGTPHARFPPEQYREAIAWLEEVSEEARRRRHVPFEKWERSEEAKREDVLEGEVHQRLEELTRLRGADGYRWYCRPLEVRYVHPAVTYSTRNLQARTDSPLFPLVKGVSQIAAATGYREPALVAYVLCDIPPVSPRLLWGWEKSNGLQLPDGTRLGRETATITLNDFTVPVRELERTVQRIRREYGETPRNAALRIILQRLGGVPAKPALDFWRQVAREWFAAGLKIRGPGARDVDAAARTLSRRFRRLPVEQKRALRRLPPTTRRTQGPKQGKSRG